MSVDSQFRSPTLAERELLRRLLEANFPGRDELVPMFEQIEVRTLDELGGLELRSRAPGRAPVVKRVPVEAEAKDEDGYLIHVLLHVVDGRPTELEIFKDDGSCVRRMPAPSAFELMVLPPAPAARPHRR
jgi:hypothetical protein